MKQTFLIIGAAGVNGSEISRLLKAEGHTVRTTTSKKPTTSDQVQIDLATGQGIAEAFKGIDRAFFLSPSGYADQLKILAPLIQEAKKRNLKKVVLMTAMGVDANEAAPLRQAELLLEKSGLNFNIIRPNWFMQNFNTFWSYPIKTLNKIPLPAEKAKTSFIDARDIAAVAAKLLVDDQYNKKAFNLTGPEALDHDQVASVLSETLGKKITYENITPEELRKTLHSAGLPKDYAELLLTLFEYVRAGYNSAVTQDVKKVLGREPISFQLYAKDFKNALA